MCAPQSSNLRFRRCACWGPTSAVLSHAEFQTMASAGTRKHWVTGEPRPTEAGAPQLRASTELVKPSISLKHTGSRTHGPTGRLAELRPRAGRVGRARHRTWLPVGPRAAVGNPKVQGRGALGAELDTQRVDKMSPRGHSASKGTRQLGYAQGAVGETERRAVGHTKCRL